MAENKERGDMSFLEHVEELRWHLVRSSIVIMVFALLAFLGKSILFDVIIFGPRNVDFPTYKFFCEVSRYIGVKEIFCLQEMPFRILNTKMAGQFSTHIWVSLIAGFIMAFPYLLWEVWRFIKPGLHSNERKYSSIILFFAAILFGIGVMFGYFLIVPLSIQFLTSYNISDEVNNLIDLMSYISTVSTITLAAGLIFELPIVVYFLARTGLLTPEWMRSYRRHAFVATLVLSAVITPPDISSQILVAFPIVILYEISIRICARVVNNMEKRQQELQSQ